MAARTTGEATTVLLPIATQDFNALHRKPRLADDESEANFLLGSCKESEAKEVDNPSAWVAAAMAAILTYFRFPQTAIESPRRVTQPARRKSP
jgi:hypothetical protein